jgi:WD40 repeat protein
MTSPLLAAARRTSAALHAAADAWTRAFLLAVDAARFGVADGGSQVRWSTGVQVTTRLLGTLCGHQRALSTVVTTTDATGRPVAVTGGPEITVSDLTTGRPVQVLDTGHSGAVHLATTVLDGRPVVVSGGSTDPALRAWDLASGARAGTVFAGHTGGTAALTTTAVDGRPVLVAAGSGGVVRRWELATGSPIGGALTDLPVVHLAALDLGGRPAVVAASGDAVCAWDAGTGAVVVPPFVARGVGALAVSVVDGLPVAVTAMQDATVRIWDLSPAPAVAGLQAKGHRGVVAAIATATVAAPGGDAATVGGRQVVVSVGADRAAHQWDPSARTAGAAHLAEIPVDVTDVAVSVAGGRVRFVGVGGAAVWCWEAGSAPELIASAAGRRLWSVATTVLDGRPVAVVGGGDGSWGGEVRIVALPTGEHGSTGDHRPTGEQSGGPGAGTGDQGDDRAFADRPGALSSDAHSGTDRDGGVGQVGGRGAGEWAGKVLTGHRSFVSSVATAVVGGRAVAVAAGLTETVARVWDLGTGTQRPLDGHGGWIRAVATVGFDGRWRAVTGDVDGVLRQWDLSTCTQHGPALTGHAGAVNAVASGLSGGEWPVAVTGGEDRTVRLWDLTTGEQIGRAWPFPEPVTAVAVAAGAVVVGFGFEVAVVDTPVFQHPAAVR